MQRRHRRVLRLIRLLSSEIVVGGVLPRGPPRLILRDLATAVALVLAAATLAQVL
jgi:hypothetical protein